MFEFINKLKGLVNDQEKKMLDDIHEEFLKLKDERDNNRYFKQLADLYTDHSKLQNEYNNLKQSIEGTVGTPIFPHGTTEIEEEDKLSRD